MSALRPKLLLACDENVRKNYLPPNEVARLESIFDWEWFQCEGGNIYEIPEDHKKAQAIGKHLTDKDALIICHGACLRLMPSMALSRLRDQLLDKPRRLIWQ